MNSFFGDANLTKSYLEPLNTRQAVFLDFKISYLNYWYSQFAISQLYI